MLFGEFGILRFAHKRQKKTQQIPRNFHWTYYLRGCFPCRKRDIAQHFAYSTVSPLCLAIYL